MASTHRYPHLILALLLACSGCGEQMVETVHPEPGDVGLDMTPLDVGTEDSDDTDVGPQGDAGGLDAELTPDAAEDVPSDTGSNSGPIMIEAQVTWDAWELELRPAPATFALPAAEGILIQDAEGALSLLDDQGFEITLEGEFGAIELGADLGESGSLLAGESGLVGFVEGQLASSPLNEHIDQPVAAMAYGPDTDQLWLATGDGLLLHEDGALYDIAPEDLPTVPARLAHGGRVDGVPSLWVASQSSIYALTGAGGDLSVSAWVEGLAALDLACDADGTVWASVNGDLYRRSTNGEWDWLRLPSPVGELAGRAESGALWIATADGVWRHQDGQFGPVEGTVTGEWLELDTDGTLIGVDDERVWRMGVGEEPLPPPPPTWTEDIQPISEARCVLCHGPGALGADQMYLREQWEERIDEILFVVSNGAMPLPPNPVLDSAMIAQIEGWKAAGFPE